jgi:hypothetical protein
MAISRLIVLDVFIVGIVSAFGKYRNSSHLVNSGSINSQMYFLTLSRALRANAAERHPRFATPEWMLVIIIDVTSFIIES